MADRKYLVIFLLLFCLKANAQEVNYQQADSTTYAQYLAGNWQGLIILGGQAIDVGVDFPLLRLRMAYAFFSTQNYTAALQQYDAVLVNDKYNQTARYYAYWCNKYLIRNQEADYHASFIDKKLLSGYDLHPFGLLNFGVETSFKFPETRRRSNASYSRVFAENRLGWRFQLTQSVAYYNQIDRGFTHLDFNQFDTDQFEYYGKLSYSLSKKWSVLGAYHYLHTNQPNNMALLGLRFTQKNVDWQADMDYSCLSGQRIFQYNAKMKWYPFGNLDFYTVSRAVWQDAVSNQFIYNQLIGGKIKQNLWVEATVTFGKQDNYLEADGLYIYNFVDETTFKTGGTAYFQLNPHLLLPLTYMFERKSNRYQSLNYNQHSVTAALIWRF